ncbi:hypothetical protein [Pseudoalteromonas denitrificans]|uniref:Extracellular solute-binding protein, family 3 n=1 Tax=Pseudoalteromonas denitrificans DSM 6059 TaxID=1123010 RepID=A0A1I1V1L2_9GAMM|nr:hypothetical protein [Pseudoalteromonas denitrificans]SFD76814.1 hypothetical protein SAMN02745724_05401 [Pseudoalteromonas denitrificans DSM 6059]
MLKKYIFIMQICVFLNFTANAKALTQPLTVNYASSQLLENSPQNYYIDVLILALEKSADKFGDFKLNEKTLETHQGRTLNLLEQGKDIDVVWSMTSIEREQRFSTIYIPLVKGLMGHRIGIIRKNEQYKFKDINNLNKLKKVFIGQGIDWPDTKILKSNGFKIVQGAGANLLSMLEIKRFDYFPRGIHEPWLEIVDNKNLVVEQTLLLKYPAPVYFFININNKILTERLKFGLHKAIQDGSFDKLFNSHEMTSTAIKKANIPQRRLFELENPLLSPKTKSILTDNNLWFSVLE